MLYRDIDIPDVFATLPPEVLDGAVLRWALRMTNTDGPALLAFAVYANKTVEEKTEYLDAVKKRAILLRRQLTEISNSGRELSLQELEELALAQENLENHLVPILTRPTGMEKDLGDICDKIMGLLRTIWERHPFQGCFSSPWLTFSAKRRMGFWNVAPGDRWPQRAKHVFSKAE